MRRKLTLDIFDYSGNHIVNLYDSSAEMSGEAVDIHRIKERNGWKELSFALPDKCYGEDGEEENYRIKYLIADYKIRFVDDKETDWYLISEPKVTHDAFHKTVSVTAGHVSQLLKNKKMSLEFSDDEGNNVGTAEELLACVLDGTDWHVGEVYQFVETNVTESDGTHPVKKRSLSAGIQTGAFRLIEMICDLFDAKPEYHGEGKYYLDADKVTVLLEADRKRMFQAYKPSGYNGNVELSTRTVVPKQQFINAGWEFEGNYGTLFPMSSMLTNKLDEKCIVVYTPIRKDGKVLTHTQITDFVARLHDAVYENSFDNLLARDTDRLVLHVYKLAVGESEEHAATVVNDWINTLNSLQSQWDSVRAENGFFGQPALDPAGIFADISGQWVNPYLTEQTGQVVDIIPMNPFSNKTFSTGGIPQDVLDGNNKVLELHYDRNLKNVSRTLNTSNIVTKLYAYGSYGDRNGLCSIQTCTHLEYTFTAAYNIPIDTELFFVDADGAKYFFTTTYDIHVGTQLIWSRLDFSSRSYIWDTENQFAYRLYKAPVKESWHEIETYCGDAVIKNKDNLFPYLFNFAYYDEVGLLDEMKFQEIAKFQRRMPELYDTCVSSATLFANELSNLSQIGNPNTGFLRFSVSGYTVQADGSTAVVLDWNQGDKGILYRSDYLNARKNWFSWHIAKDLKANGDPLTGTPSYVLIAHSTKPITWEKAYVKEIWMRDKYGMEYRVNDSTGNPGDFVYALQNEDAYPSRLVLWAPMATDNRSRSLPTYTATDQFFLFCTNSQSGEICGLEIQDESIINSEIKTSIGSENEVHPVYFMDARPGIDTVPTTSVVRLENQFGWYYKYYLLENRMGDLFFCGKTDTDWYSVIISDVKPAAASNGTYFLDSVYRILYRYIQGKWVEYESTEEKKIAQCFTKVLYYCNKRDELYRGLFDYYYHKVDGLETGKEMGGLPVGRYAIDSGYDYYWTFSTTKGILKDSTLKVDTKNKYVYQDDDIANILSATVVPKYATERSAGNLISFSDFSNGWINANNGSDINLDEFVKEFTDYRSRYIKVYPGETYTLSMPDYIDQHRNHIGMVFFYDGNKTFRNVLRVGDGLSIGGGTFVVPKATGIDPDDPAYKPDACYLRIAWPNLTSETEMSLSLENYDKKIFLNDNSNTLYTLLSTTSHGENLLGLSNLMARFVNSANRAYVDLLGKMQDAQEEIKISDDNLQELLGPLLREGYWKDDSYVEGDEPKLYNDALDNLNEIAKPEASYTITFVDQYGSNENMGYSVDGESDLIPYQDIDISNAVHLVDPSADINCWAYLDKVNTCYDKNWLTNIEINTRLSLIGQHDFTDVLSSIAEVAKINKNKQSMYDASAEMNGINKSGVSFNGVIVNGGNFNGVLIEGANYEGVTTTGASYNGMPIQTSLYIGVRPEGLNYGGTQINAESVGSVTIDDEPIEGVIIKPANVSGFIIRGIDFVNAVTSGIASENTIEQRVRLELESILASETLKLQNSVSKWHIDDKGSLIFEDIGENRAIRICGAGIGFANKKNLVTGEYEWNSAMTGDGISADSITSGTLKSCAIEVGSIKANQLSADAGQLLDISSNRGLDLFATTTGEKPSGALKTTDAIIEIHSAIPGVSDTAQINVKSGGDINLIAGPGMAYNEDGTPKRDADGDIIDVEGHKWKDRGTININANRAVNIQSGGELDIRAGGNAYIEAGGNMDIMSAGTMNIQSGAKQDVLGEVNILSTGDLNVKGNGTVTVAAGVTKDVDGVYYDVNHNIFTITYNDDGVPTNIAYDEDGYTYAKGTEPKQYIYIKTGNNQFEKAKGGQIIINSVNGIEIATYGSMKLAAGSSENVDGKIDIQAQGEVNILSGGKMYLRSGELAEDKGGEMIIESTGTLEMEAGSNMRIGVGRAYDEVLDRHARLDIGSTGEMVISSNGTLTLSSVTYNVNDKGELIEVSDVQAHRYKWKEYPFDVGDIIAKGEVTATPGDDTGKERAMNMAVAEIERQADAWYATSRDKDTRDKAVITAISSLEHYTIDSHNKEYCGGRIIVKSENGIDIKSGGTINIESGAEQDVQGNINIRSTGNLTIGANGSLRIDAGSEDVNAQMFIGSTGEMHLEAGSLMTLGAGRSGDRDAKLNIGSSGEINVDAGGEIHVRSGEADTAATKFTYSWFSDPEINLLNGIIPKGETYEYSDRNAAYNAFVQEITEYADDWLERNGDTENNRYRRDDAIRRTKEMSVLHAWDKNGDEIIGGKIAIHAANGLEIESGGNLKIGSGGSGSVNGILSIMSTGQMMIGANAELLLAAGDENHPKGGKMTIDSTGLIDIRAGAEMKLGVGGKGDAEAKLSVGSTGTIDILANGSMHLRAGVTKDGIMDYYINDNGYKKFTVIYDETTGKPINIKYNDDGYAMTTSSQLLYYKTDTSYAPVKGSTIEVESTSGIVVKSYGSVKIGSGSQAEADGAIEIASTGKIDILANGQLRLAAGVNKENVVTYYTKRNNNYYAYAVSFDDAGNPDNFYYDKDGYAVTSSNAFLYTKAGTEYIKAKGGSIIIESTNGIEVNSLGSIKIQSGGEETVNGSIVIGSTGTINIESQGKMYLAGGSIEMNSDSLLNVFGGSINIQADPDKDQKGKLNISGGSVNINSGSELIVKAEGKIDIQSGSTFTVASENFEINNKGDVSITGTINATGGKIAEWKITGNKLYSGSTTDEYVCLDSGTSGQDYAIWAGNSTASQAPFRVNRDGTLYATEAHITGSIDAKDGIIAGFNIEDSCIWNGKSVVSSGNAGVYIGIDGISVGSHNIGDSDNPRYVPSFMVTEDGNVTMYGTVYASSGEFTGTVTAENGSIGGWVLGKTRIYSGKDEGDTHTYVALDSGTTGVEYAMWIGSTTPTAMTTTFSVKRNGYLYAKTGKIAGFDFGVSDGVGYICNGKASIDSNNDGVYIGANGISLGKGQTFRVTNTGSVIAANMTINGASTFTGAITASNLSITGGSISLSNGNYKAYLGSDKLFLGPNTMGVADGFYVSYKGDTTVTKLTVHTSIQFPSIQGSASGMISGTATNKVTINNTSISDSSFSGGTVTSTLSGCTVSGTLSGGTITSTLSGCTISGTLSSGTITSTLSGCTISGNLSGGTITNVTIASGNVSPFGAVKINGATLTGCSISGGSISGTSAASLISISNASISSSSYSGGLTSCSFGGTSSGTIQGTASNKIAIKNSVITDSSFTGTAYLSNSSTFNGTIQGGVSYGVLGDRKNDVDYYGGICRATIQTTGGTANMYIYGNAMGCYNADAGSFIPTSGYWGKMMCGIHYDAADFLSTATTNKTFLFAGHTGTNTPTSADTGFRVIANTGNVYVKHIYIVADDSTNNNVHLHYAKDKNGVYHLYAGSKALT